MTKKHFEAFAWAIKQLVLVADTKSGKRNKLHQRAEAQANLICAVAPQFNPAFNEARFLHACGL